MPGKYDNLNADELYVAPTDAIDVSQFEGMKSKIAEFKISTKRSDYDEKGTLVPGLQREVPVLEVYSEKLGETETGKPVVAMERFNLKIDAKTGKPVYSLHQKSKVTKLFGYFKVNSLQELKGKPITVLARSSATSDRKWLGFNY